MYQPDKLFPLPESLPAETVRGFSADLKGLCEWLSMQDGATKYDFHTQNTCLIGHFHMAIGLKPEAFADSLNRYGFELDGIAARYPWTYGAALERARSALREGGK